MAASRKSKNKPASTDPNLRHAWLASLGVLVVARRESDALVQRLMAGAQAAANRVATVARRAESDLRGGIRGVRRQVQPKVVKFSSEVEARLAPLRDKLGLATGKARNARKPAARTSVRRTPRKPARRAARHAAR